MMIELDARDAQPLRGTQAGRLAGSALRASAAVQADQHPQTKQIDAGLYLEGVCRLLQADSSDCGAFDCVVDDNGAPLQSGAVCRLLGLVVCDLISSASVSASCDDTATNKYHAPAARSAASLRFRKQMADAVWLVCAIRSSLYGAHRHRARAQLRPAFDAGAGADCSPARYREGRAAYSSSDFRL
jgi:hypothetical protein